MKLNNLAVGDVVSLNSGGPPMSVCFISDSEQTDVLCVWFNKLNGNQESSIFPLQSLVLVRKLDDLEEGVTIMDGIKVKQLNLFNNVK